MLPLSTTWPTMVTCAVAVAYVIITWKDRKGG